MKDKIFYLKRIWWGFREAWRFPIMSALYSIVVIGLFSKSVATIFVLLIILNYSIENNEGKNGD